MSGISISFILTKFSIFWINNYSVSLKVLPSEAKELDLCKETKLYQNIEVVLLYCNCYLYRDEILY